MQGIEPDGSTAKPEEQDRHVKFDIRGAAIRLHDSIRPQHRGPHFDDAVPSVASNNGLHSFRMELVVHGGPADFGARGRPLWCMGRYGLGLLVLGSVMLIIAACVG